VKIAAIALTLLATSGWHVIGRSPSARGMVADVAAKATVRHPHALAVRVVGGGSVTGEATVRCARAGRSATIDVAFTGRFARLELPLANPRRCSISARATGTGQIRLEILAK
jgi:hypothetical protein